MCMVVPARVAAIVDPDSFLVDVEINGSRQTVSLILLAKGDYPVEAWIDSWVTVHAGFAMRQVSEADARAIASLIILP